MKRWCPWRLAPWRGHKWKENHHTLFSCTRRCEGCVKFESLPLDHDCPDKHALKGWLTAVDGGSAAQEPAPTSEPRDKPFVGWRAWKMDVDDDGPVLVSTYKGTHWTGPVLHAEGEIGFRSDENQVAHGPGIYTLKSWEGLRYPIVGEVELWGRVIEHAKGYRAEHAMVRALYQMPLRQKTVTRNTFIGRQKYARYVLAPTAPALSRDIQDALAERYQCTVDTERFRRVAELRQQVKGIYQWTSENQNESGKSSRTESSLHVPDAKETEKLTSEFRPNLPRQSLSDR